MKKLNTKTLLAWVCTFAFALCSATGALAMNVSNNVAPVHCGTCGVGGETEDHENEKKDEKKDDKKKDDKKKDDKKDDKKDEKKKDEKPK